MLKTAKRTQQEMAMQMMDMPMSMGMPMMCRAIFYACFPVCPTRRATFSDLSR